MPCYVTFLRDAAVADESAAGQYIRTPSRNLENSISTTYSHALTHLFTHFPGLSRTLSLSSTCSPCAIYSFTLISTLSLTHKHALSPNHSQRHTLSFFSQCPSLSHKLLFTHALTHLPIIHPSTHSNSHSLIRSLSLSLSGVYARAYVSVPLSFFLSLLLLRSLSGFLSVSLFLFYTHTRTHAVTRSLSSLTHTRTHKPDLYPHLLAHSLTFLSLSLSLSLSLLHTYTNTHTHSHSHILSLVHSPSHSFITVAGAFCAVFSARTRARSLLSVSLPLPPFLILFLSDYISLLPLSSLACSPSFSHSFASSRFQLLVAMFSI